jgi:hypothetical protein
MGASFLEAQAFRALGELARAKGHPSEARDRLETAVQQFQNCGAVPDALETLEALVDVCESLGCADEGETWRARGKQLAAGTDVGWDEKRGRAIIADGGRPK